MQSLSPYAALVLLSLGTPAYATLWNVAGNGVDSVTCGGAKQPCRTISYAIQHSVANDVIAVGPGIYGDIDGDGALTSVGDEQPTAGPNGELALVNIDKPLQIYSLRGAGVTRIDGTPRNTGVHGLQNYAGVLFSSGNVAFGIPQQGFTIASDGNYGVVGAGTTNAAIRVSGNLFIGNTMGISLFSDQSNVHDNMAVGNTTGFNVGGQGAKLHNNTAQSNGTAYNIVGSSETRLYQNTALSNNVGYYIDGPVTGDHNSAIGNLFEGVHLIGAGPVSWTYGNIQGNQLADPNHDCEFINETTGDPVQAGNNYWGFKNGPHANQICNSTVQTVTAPVKAAPTTIPQSNVSPF